MPFPEDLPDPGIEPRFSALQADALPSEPPGKPQSSASGKKKKTTKKNLLAGDIRDTGLIPGLGRSPGGGHGNPVQYSCLEENMD